MLIENLMHKWYDVKRKTLYSHKPHSPALSTALSSLGLNKELSEYESTHKLNLLAIEDKWDFKFDCWLDVVEQDTSRYKLSQINTIMNNFSNRFHNDVVKEFPKKEFILYED